MTLEIMQFHSNIQHMFSRSESTYAIEHIDMVLGTVLDVKLDVDFDLLIGMNAWNDNPIRGGLRLV